MIRAALLFFVVVLPLQAATAQTDIDEFDLSGVVDGNNRFALDLYQQLRSEDGNLFFSPSSIAIALSMTYAGAAGLTATEMAETLHLPKPIEGIHAQMKALQGTFLQTNKESHIELKLANRLWGPKTYQFLPAFLQITREYYGAELSQLDFAQSEAARQRINRWVEDQTEQKIRDLVPRGLITSETKLVLTNAIYFYADWTTAFDQTLTEPAEFRVNPKDNITVSMMFRSERLHYWYSEVDDLQILELPYGDGSLSMVVLLPGKLDGLDAVQSKLTFENFQRWTNHLKQEQKVLVYLPKFTATSKFELGKRLATMGMTSAFDPGNADFSGMTADGQPFISKVIHQAFVDVGEQGTEAAAATVVLGAVPGPADGDYAAPELPEFRADHPFLFLIRENRSGAIQFVGRITDPTVYAPGQKNQRVERAGEMKKGKGKITGSINTRSTLRGTLTLMPVNENDSTPFNEVPIGSPISLGELKIGSARPRFEFNDLPEGTYDLEFRGTKDGKTTPLKWKGLQLDRSGKERELELSAAQ